MTSEPREAQMRAHISPIERGPSRPGLRWEVVGIAFVAVFGWALVIHAAGVAVGWW